MIKYKNVFIFKYIKFIMISIEFSTDIGCFVISKPTNVEEYKEVIYQLLVFVIIFIDDELPNIQTNNKNQEIIVDHLIFIKEFIEKEIENLVNINDINLEDIKKKFVNIYYSTELFVFCEFDYLCKYFNDVRLNNFLKHNNDIIKLLELDGIKSYEFTKVIDYLLLIREFSNNIEKCIDNLEYEGIENEITKDQIDIQKDLYNLYYNCDVKDAKEKFNNIYQKYNLSVFCDLNRKFINLNFDFYLYISIVKNSHLLKYLL